METIKVPPNGWVAYTEQCLPSAEADRCFDLWQSSLKWAHYSVKLFGKDIPQPRLTALYGEEGITYRYSGLTLSAHPWEGAMRSLARQLSEQAGVAFNSVLCNLYRDGQDSMGWHADDEAELGDNPIIASVSLGAVRRFDLRPKKGRPGEKFSIALAHGSALIMGGDLQHHWQHQIAKTKRINSARLNLTFRQILH